MTPPHIHTLPFSAMELYVLRETVASDEPLSALSDPRLLVQRFLATVDDLAATNDNWRMRVARRAGVEDANAFWVDILDALDEKLDARTPRAAVEVPHDLHMENADLRSEVARLRMQRGVLADVLLHAEAQVAQLLDRKRA